MLAPIESNIIPLPHQILALEKVMAGQFHRFLIADEVGMGKTIETGLIKGRNTIYNLSANSNCKNKTRKFHS